MTTKTVENGTKKAAKLTLRQEAETLVSAVQEASNLVHANAKKNTTLRAQYAHIPLFERPRLDFLPERVQVETSRGPIEVSPSTDTSTAVFPTCSTKREPLGVRLYVTPKTGELKTSSLVDTDVAGAIALILRRQS